MPIPVISTPIADVKTGRINEIWYRWFFEVSTRLDTLTSDLAALTTLVTPIAGSWTPVLAFGGASTGIVYTTQIARYIKQGDLVSVWLSITISDNGSSTGSATITGLPYAASSATDLDSSGVFANVDGFSGGVGIPMCHIENNTSVITLRQFDNTTGGSSALEDTDIPNGAAFSIQLTYRTG